MLHLGAETQRERLRARLDDPAEHREPDHGDVDGGCVRPRYEEAREIARQRTSAEVAPWDVVPPDRTWYRNLAVGRLPYDTLAGTAPARPAADLDPAEQRARPAAEGA